MSKMNLSIYKKKKISTLGLCQPKPWYNDDHIDSPNHIRSPELGIKSIVFSVGSRAYVNIDTLE